MISIQADRIRRMKGITETAEILPKHMSADDLDDG